MPIYTYKCRVCGEVLSVNAKFTDPPLEHCHESMEKQVARSDFKLQGTGWYKDGYRGK